MTLKPRTYSDNLYTLLREGRIDEFNSRKAVGEKTDLTNCDFRNLDLRGIDAQSLDFSGSYFRQADLRGIDFSRTNLTGCSLNGARISGVYFPKELSPDEITMSLMHGTRLRYRS